MKTLSNLALRLPSLYPNRALRSMRTTARPYISAASKHPVTACSLRSATAADLRFLASCLALAAHEPLVDRALAQPSIKRYLKDWMRPNDFGFIASKDGQDIGAVWARQFQPGDQPFVWAGHSAPELTIAVLPNGQGQGVGQALLNALAVEARQRNLKGLCLNVRDDNPAIRLYERVGFRPIAQSEITNRVGGVSFGMLLSL